MGNNNFLVYKAELPSGSYIYLSMSKFSYDRLPKTTRIIRRIIIRDKLSMEEAVSFCTVISKLKGV